MNEARGLGRVLFASVFLMIGGVVNVIYGIAAISNSHFFASNQHYVFATLKGWGWITLIIGIFQMLASVSILAGGTLGLALGILSASLAALSALLDIPAYPLLSIALFALSLWIIQGLVVYGRWARSETG